MNLVSLKTAMALPEIFLAAMASLILILGLFLKESSRDKACYWLSLFTLVATALLVLNGFSSNSVIAFNGLFISDPMGALLKIAVCLISTTVFTYTRQYNQDRDIFKSEYYVLGLFSVTGMMVMISASHLLSLYLGLELMSLCLYAMIAFYRDDKLAVESAMKYFVLGALASSILLYGMSLIYGLTGSLELSVISSTLSTIDQGNLALALAVVFVVVSLAFKLGVVPFHMWVPDVYQGAPTSTTAFMGSVPKIAAFAIIMRLLVGGLGELHDMWQQMLIILAILSVGIGNIIAIAQDNLKRMLAYSTISHMGFFLFGILSGAETGYSASLLYVIVYAAMSAASFGVILCLASEGNEFDKLSDLAGLSKRNPGLAFLLLVLMLSMSGIPPTAGFFAKLSVIQALVDAQLLWVAVTAVILAVIGAFYYLRIIKLAYFDDPVEGHSAPVTVRTDSKAALTVNVLLMVAILPWIGSLIDICNDVISNFGS
ncbi:MAG: NADH-quinone oxidoreductase subunit NuoN [Gammaproteobacteria bacterium]|nr:NADH-quinone oxidoreductase subunit NuoN [Gammaproteobacteria bacterium]